MATRPYDPKVLYEYADRLYARAAGIALTYALLGLLLAGLVGGVAFGATGLLVGAVIGAVVGWQFGKQQAFHLRLQAQLALVQAKIEENTRPFARSQS